MFSSEELVRHAYWPGPEDEPPLMEVAEFHRHQFSIPIQGYLVAHRGDKPNFQSALVFWLWSLQLVDRPTTSKGFLHFAEVALCEPIDEQTWYQMIDGYTFGLKRPPPEFLCGCGSFVAGLKMYAGVVLSTLRVSILAEFKNDYVAFHSRVAL